MEPNFQTSFIPKKPIIKEHVAPSRSVGLLTIVAIFIFFSVLIATGGFFIFKGIMARSIAEKEKTLDLAKSRFEPSKISQLQVLDKRLRAASEVLSGHVAISPIFQALEDITMKTVRYTNFTYKLNNNEAPKVLVKMVGEAVGYRSIALQSDLLTKNKYFIDPVFSNLILDEKGNVMFNLEFSVEPSFVDYKQMLKLESGVPN